MEYVFSGGLHFYNGIPAYPAQGSNNVVIHHAPWCQDPYGGRCNCGTGDVEDAVTAGIGSLERAVERIRKNGWDGEKWITDRRPDF